MVGDRETLIIQSYYRSFHRVRICIFLFLTFYNASLRVNSPEGFGGGGELPPTELSRRL